MREISYTTMDKSTWERGEWDGEPDKRQWQDKDTGYACLIVRGHHGALCGYVGLPVGHKLYEVDYTESEAHYDLDVHGGITFSDKCDPKANESTGICHISEQEVYWYGFDCSHSWDVSPAYDAFIKKYHDNGSIPRCSLSMGGDTSYRNFDYVTNEVTKLAAQLHQLA